MTGQGGADRPRATVVVTSYNQEQWIEQALDSVGEEGRQIQRIVRRGGAGTDKSHVKWRRALVVQASLSDYTF